MVNLNSADKSSNCTTLRSFIYLINLAFCSQRNFSSSSGLSLSWPSCTMSKVALKYYQNQQNQLLSTFEPLPLHVYANLLPTIFGFLTFSPPQFLSNALFLVVSSVFLLLSSVFTPNTFEHPVQITSFSIPRCAVSFPAFSAALEGLFQREPRFFIGLSQYLPL